MPNRSFWIAAALLACTPAPARAAEVEASFSGYLETRHFGVFGVSDSLKLLGDLGLVDFDAVGFHPDQQYGAVNRLRPTLKLKIGGNATVVATAEGRTSHGFFGRSINSVGDVVGLERLYFTLSLGKFDLLAGKMLLRWGNGLLTNPTDPFNSKSPDDLDAELPGLWGVRALVALTDVSNLTLAVAVEEGDVPGASVGRVGTGRCCGPVVVGRYDHTVGLTDLAVTFTWDKRPGLDGRARDGLLVTGFDLKTEFEIGFWAEAAFTWDLDAEEGFFSSELGIDYTFAVPKLEQLYVALEWIHQGDGVGSEWGDAGEPPPDYFAATLSGLTGGKRRALQGTNYLLALVRIGIDSKWRIQVLNSLNLRDPSGTVAAQVTWLPTGYFEFVLGAQANYGRTGGEYALVVPNSAPLPDIRGARLVPWASAYLWGRFYF